MLWAITCDHKNTTGAIKLFFFPQNTVRVWVMSFFLIKFMICCPFTWMLKNDSWDGAIVMYDHSGDQISFMYLVVWCTCIGNCDTKCCVFLWYITCLPVCLLAHFGLVCGWTNGTEVQKLSTRLYPHTAVADGLFLPHQHQCIISSPCVQHFHPA